MTTDGVESLAAPTDDCAGKPGVNRPAHCEVIEELPPEAESGLRAGPEPVHAAPPAPAGPSLSAVVCDGDGTSGKRVEVLYVRESSMPDRYTQFLPMFRAWLANVDDQFNDGAALDGRSRHLRYVTEPVGGSCRPVIRNVVVPAGSLNSFDSSKAAVGALGYNASNRKYVMLTEALVYCGVADAYQDDTAGATNIHNVITSYGRVDAYPGCLGANAIAHELGHMFGATQASAPHGGPGYHCVEYNDMMCATATPTWTCVQWNARRLPELQPR